MKKIKTRGLGLMTAVILSIGGLVGCSGSEEAEDATKTKEPVEITVSAAASLTEAMGEIEKLYEEESGVELNMNYGSSGALQKQIEEGAPTDLFISAGKKQMDALDKAGLVKSDSVKNLLGNKLVLIVSEEYADKIKSVDDLANTDGKIAVGEVETVPVGQYSKESLENLNAWGLLQDKLVFAKDVKAVLSYVESGEAVAGIVYKSDAVGLKSAKIAQEIDSSTHKEIVYPEAIIESTESEDTVKEFMEFLSNEDSKQVFEKYGFEVK